jgi:protein TonB
VCRKRGQEGVVCLHVKTNKEGQVIKVSLHKSSGHDLLDKAALEAVKSWILSERNSDKTLSIAFRLEGQAVSFS